MHQSLFRFAFLTAHFGFKQSAINAFQPCCSRRSKQLTEKVVTTTTTRLFTAKSEPMTAADATAAATVTTGSSSDPRNLPLVPATAKRLFLVRHGEVINPGGDRAVYYGAMDVPLSPLGEQEAVAAAQYLSQFDLAAVFSSNLSRAIYGAEQVVRLQQDQKQQRQQQHLQVQQLEGFKELDRGDWCGKTKEEIGADNMARFDACDETVTPGNGGESYPALKRRVLAALHDSVLHQIQAGESAAIVSHLQVTRCMVSEALGIPIEQMTTLPVATASVTCIDYYDDGCDSTFAAASTAAPPPTVHFQSFKPDVGLSTSKDGAN